MKAMDVLSKELQTKNEEYIYNGYVYHFSMQEGKMYIPDVEFGKTYYLGRKKKGCETKKLFAVKFYGFTNTTIGLGLIGVSADGDTIIYVGNEDNFMSYNKETGFAYGENKTTYLCNSYLYESVEDYNEDKKVPLVLDFKAFAKIFDYCYPQQINFQQINHNSQDKFHLYPFRYSWNGIKAVRHTLNISISNKYIVLFEKPMCSLKFQLFCSGRSVSVEPNDIEIGKIYRFVEDSGVTFMEDINFSQKENSYYSEEECIEDNKIEVVEFEDNKKDMKVDMVYIEFVGLVPRKKAEKILQELNEKFK